MDLGTRWDRMKVLEGGEREEGLSLKQVLNEEVGFWWGRRGFSNLCFFFL
jgi:hypothetical protein